MQTTVIIPNYNGQDLLGPCLDSLRAQTRPPARVVVVDNASTDRSRELIAGHALGAETVTLDNNQGFAAAVNAGIERADTAVVTLLNNDAVADPRWLEAGLAALEQYPEVSMVASLMLDAQNRDRVDNAGDLVGRDGRARPRGRGRHASGYDQPALVLSACAGAAFYRRRLFDEVGRFEDAFFAYLEDVDLGLRARSRGHDCVFAPTAVVYHLGAATELGDGHAKRRVDSAERVFWIARNRVRLLARNLPPRLLLAWSPLIALGLARGLAYHLLASRQGGAFARGAAEGARLWSRDRELFRTGATAGGFDAAARMMREGARPWPPRSR